MYSEFFVVDEDDSYNDIDIITPSLPDPILVSDDDHEDSVHSMSHETLVQESNSLETKRDNVIVVNDDDVKHENSSVCRLSNTVEHKSNKEENSREDNQCASSSLSMNATIIEFGQKTVQNEEYYIEKEKVATVSSLPTNATLLNFVQTELSEVISMAQSTNVVETRKNETVHDQPMEIFTTELTFLPSEIDNVPVIADVPATNLVAANTNLIPTNVNNTGTNFNEVVSRESDYLSDVTKSVSLSQSNKQTENKSTGSSAPSIEIAPIATEAVKEITIKQEKEEPATHSIAVKTELIIPSSVNVKVESVSSETGNISKIKREPNLTNIKLENPVVSNDEVILNLEPTPIIEIMSDDDMNSTMHFKRDQTKTNEQTELSQVTTFGSMAQSINIVETKKNETDHDQPMDILVFTSEPTFLPSEINNVPVISDLPATKLMAVSTNLIPTNVNKAETNLNETVNREAEHLSDVTKNVSLPQLNKQTENKSTSLSAPISEVAPIAIEAVKDILKQEKEEPAIHSILVTTEPIMPSSVNVKVESVSSETGNISKIKREPNLTNIKLENPVAPNDEVIVNQGPTTIIEIMSDDDMDSTMYIVKTVTKTCSNQKAVKTQNEEDVFAAIFGIVTEIIDLACEKSRNNEVSEVREIQSQVVLNSSDLVETKDINKRASLYTETVINTVTISDVQSAIESTADSLTIGKITETAHGEKIINLNVELVVPKDKTSHAHEDNPSKFIHNEMYCQKCGEYCQDVHKYLIHLSITHDDINFPCPICLEVFQSFHDLTKHYSIHSDECAQYQSEYLNENKNLFYCFICGENLRELEKCDSHMQIHKEILIACPSCELSFNSYGAIISHYSENHKTRLQDSAFNKKLLENFYLEDSNSGRTPTTQEKLHCLECGESSHDVADLLLHMTRIHRHLLRCPVCNRKFRTVHSLIRHYKKEGLSHKVDHKPLLYCETCGKKLKDLKDIDMHPECHKKMHFKCSPCNKIFSNYTAVYSHYLDKHVLEDRIILICYRDQSEYSSVEEYCKHMKTHTGLKDMIYTCVYCKASYFKIFDFKTHLLNHRRKRTYDCILCNSIFVDKQRLIRHHCGKINCKTDRSRCDLCKKLVLSRSMKCHLEWHKIFGSVEEKTICHRCDETFPTFQLLIEHSKICNKTREVKQINQSKSALLFPCKSCRKNFNMKSEFLEHIKSYHSEFPCPDCGAIFTKKELLPEHQRICFQRSTLLYAHACDDCDKRFKNALDLRNHRKDKHKEKRKIVTRSMTTKEEIPPKDKHSVKQRSPTDSDHISNSIRSESISTKPSYSCSSCNVSFDTEHGLAAHKMLVNHKQPGSEKLVEHKQSESEKLVEQKQPESDNNKKGTVSRPVHCCSACGGDFETSSGLKIHLSRGLVECVSNQLQKTRDEVRNEREKSADNVLQPTIDQRQPIDHLTQPSKSSSQVRKRRWTNPIEVQIKEKPTSTLTQVKIFRTPASKPVVHSTLVTSTEPLNPSLKPRQNEGPSQPKKSRWSDGSEANMSTKPIPDKPEKLHPILTQTKVPPSPPPTNTEKTAVITETLPQPWFKVMRPPPLQQPVQNMTPFQQPHHLQQPVQNMAELMQNQPHSSQPHVENMQQLMLTQHHPLQEHVQNMPQLMLNHHQALHDHVQNMSQIMINQHHSLQEQAQNMPQLMLNQPHELQHNMHQLMINRPHDFQQSVQNMQQLMLNHGHDLQQPVQNMHQLMLQQSVQNMPQPMLNQDHSQNMPHLMRNQQHPLQAHVQNMPHLIQNQLYPLQEHVQNMPHLMLNQPHPLQENVQNTPYLMLNQPHLLPEPVQNAPLPYPVLQQTSYASIVNTEAQGARPFTGYMKHHARLQGNSEQKIKTGGQASGSQPPKPVPPPFIEKEPVRYSSKTKQKISKIDALSQNTSDLQKITKAAEKSKISNMHTSQTSDNVTDLTRQPQKLQYAYTTKNIIEIKPINQKTSLFLESTLSSSTTVKNAQVPYEPDMAFEEPEDNLVAPPPPSVTSSDFIGFNTDTEDLDRKDKECTICGEWFLIPLFDGHICSPF